MYIEKKQSWLFLVKKNNWAVFLTKLDNNLINKVVLEKITEKECDYIFKSEKYKIFEKEIFNKKNLKEIIFKSKFLNNNIEILKIIWLKNINIKNKKLSESLNWEEILYKKWLFYQKWIEKTFPIQFIYNSNNIEWSRIPQEEVEKIILKWEKTYKIKNEIQEVENSHKAWNFLNTKFVFNEINIKKIYHIFTKNLFREWNLKYPRWFKKIKVIVNNEETTPPENVSKEINLLLENYKKNKKEIFPLQIAFDFHLKYEQIHPFEDWNWRTWRLFMNKALMQNWFLPMIVFKENKSSYFSSIASCKDKNKKKYYTFMIKQYKKTIDEFYDINFEKIN